MSFFGYVMRKTGVYARLQEHFAETLLPTFAISGQVSIEERRFLGELARGLRNDGPIIEVGTLFGASTTVLAANKDPARKLITVDKYVWNPCGLSRAQHQRLTGRILKDSIKCQNVEQIILDKNEFYASYRGEAPAMVFLDADHSYQETLKDIQWALSVKARLIAGHDYASNMPGVAQAVDQSGGAAKVVGTVWVLRQ